MFWVLCRLSHHLSASSALASELLSRKLWNKPSTYHGVVLLGRALYSYIGKGINGTSDLSAKLNQGIFIAFNNPIFKLSWAE